MTVQELLNFLQAVPAELPVVVKVNGVCVPAYYEYETGEEGGPAQILIKKK